MAFTFLHLHINGFQIGESRSYQCSLQSFFTLHKKWNFPLRIPSVNLTESAVSCGFGHIYWRNPQKLHFLCIASNWFRKLGNLEVKRNIGRKWEKKNTDLSPFQLIVVFQIETNHSIYTSNQMTGFYIKCKTGPKWVKWFIKRVYLSNFKELNDLISRFEILCFCHKFQVC